mgnify:CR=1 FL=1
MKTKYFTAIALLSIGLSFIPFTPVKLVGSESNTKQTEFSIGRPAITKIQLALLLDTSNSMDGLINQAKNQLWETISHLSKETPDAKIEIAIYQYGNDNLSVYNNYVQKILDFSSNLDEVSSKLFKLQTNGGSEYCGAVIHNAQKELNWDDGIKTKRVMVIAGNEPFNQGNTSYATSIASSVKKDIQVNTIFCGNHNTGINNKWKEGAVLGNGQYFSINQNNDVRQIATPYDDKILSCNKKINKTYVPVYEVDVEEQEEMVENDKEQAVAQKERLVEKALIKKNKTVYNKSSWDAIDNYVSNGKDVSKMKSANKGSLNSRFANKSDKEIEKEILVIKTERDSLHLELSNLEELRLKFITENQNSDSDKKTLGYNLVQSILK